MELTEYISKSILNIEKKIDRAKNKSINDTFDFNILKRIDISFIDADFNDKKILDFIRLHKTNMKTKIQCSEIENNIEYNVESERHDYCHTSTWITDVVNNLEYSYYEIKDKCDIDIMMVINEAIKIAEISKNKDDLKMLNNFIGLIISKKIDNRKIINGR